MMTPQNCADCGVRAEPGQSFCDACGAVLSWDRPAARSGAATPGDLSAASSSAGSTAASSPAGTTAPASADGAPGWNAFTPRDGDPGRARTLRNPPSTDDHEPDGAPRDAEPGGSHTTPSRSTLPHRTPGEAPTPAAATPGAGRARTIPSGNDGSAPAAAPGGSSGAAASGAGGPRTSPSGSDGTSTAAAAHGGSFGAAASGAGRSRTSPSGSDGTSTAAAAHGGSFGAAAPGAGRSRTISSGSDGTSTAAAEPDGSFGAADPGAGGAHTFPSDTDGIPATNEHGWDGRYEPSSGAGAAGDSYGAPAPGIVPPRDETAATEPLPHAAAPTAAPDAMTERARRLLIPVADPEPRPAASPSVAPVLPGRPAPQRPQTVRAPGQELGTDGGVPCPWCATPNHPDRHHCARCAMPMTRDGHVAGQRPWWRRLLDFRTGETPWAGDRPRLRRTFDRVLTWLGAALVLTLLIVAGANVPRAVQATRDHFAKRAPVAPDTVGASRSYPGHKPQLAFDKLSNTWWGPGVSQSGEGQWIEAHFDEPTRLLDVVITPGVSTHPEQLSQSAQPHRIKATVKTADGKTTTRELTLDQGAGGQRRAFRVTDATSVRFTLESAYGPSADKQVAIAEIEFFGPSNANGS